jgi:hypothetical protein
MIYKLQDTLSFSEQLQLKSKGLDINIESALRTVYFTTNEKGELIEYTQGGLNHNEKNYKIVETIDELFEELDIKDIHFKKDIIEPFFSKPRKNNIQEWSKKNYHIFNTNFKDVINSDNFPTDMNLYEQIQLHNFYNSNNEAKLIDMIEQLPFLKKVFLYNSENSSCLITHKDFKNKHYYVQNKSAWKDYEYSYDNEYVSYTVKVNKLIQYLINIADNVNGNCSVDNKHKKTSNLSNDIAQIVKLNNEKYMVIYSTNKTEEISKSDYYKLMYKTYTDISTEIRNMSKVFNETYNLNYYETCKKLSKQ